MIDLDDLKTFAKLPHIFTVKLYREIQDAINDYDGYKAYVIRRLEYYGEGAYKNPDTYTEVKYDVLNDRLPEPTERRILAVIEQMKLQNCKENQNDKV